MYFLWSFFIQVKFCSTPYQRTYPYSSMVLLFEFSAFGIIFHGVKSVLFIGNLTHSPWTGHNYNRIHVPCLACDFICFKGHLTCAQREEFFKTIPEGAHFSQTGRRTTQKHHMKLTWNSNEIIVWCATYLHFLLF